MRVTVFGGSGFIGSHVCDCLSDHGHEVTLFDRAPSPWLRPDQTMVVGDIASAHLVREAVQGADAVYNFAGIADIAVAADDPLGTITQNIHNNAILLEAARQADVGRYLFASTIYVYSDKGGFYRCSKQACELYIREYARLHGLEYTILRYGSVYGPRSGPGNSIHDFVQGAVRHGRMEYAGPADAMREYIHVMDAARSSVDMLADQYANSNVILTGTQTLRIGEVMETIAEILGTRPELVFRNKTDNGHYAKTCYAYIPDKAYKYVPPMQIDFAQGLLEAIHDAHGDDETPARHREQGAA